MVMMLGCLTFGMALSAVWIGSTTQEDLTTLTIGLLVATVVLWVAAAVARPVHHTPETEADPTQQPRRSRQILRALGTTLGAVLAFILGLSSLILLNNASTSFGDPQPTFRETVHDAPRVDAHGTPREPHPDEGRILAEDLHATDTTQLAEILHVMAGIGGSPEFLSISITPEQITAFIAPTSGADTFRQVTYSTAEGFARDDTRTWNIADNPHVEPLLLHQVKPARIDRVLDRVAADSGIDPRAEGTRFNLTIFSRAADADTDTTEASAHPTGVIYSVDILDPAAEPGSTARNVPDLYWYDSAAEPFAGF